MTEQNMLDEVVTKILTERCSPEVVRQAESSGWAPGVWDALAEAGLPWVSIPEEAGGSGGSLSDAHTVLRAVGRFAAPVPAAETSVLAGWLLARVGLEIPKAPLTIAVGHTQDAVALRHDGGRGWTLSGELHRVPWARASARVVLIASVEGADHVVSLPSERVAIEDVTNLAGEPRETIRFDRISVAADEVAVAPDDVDVDTLRLRGALARASLMAGALDRVTSETVAYAGEREQFGRPIGRFQAVQTHLVRMAEQAACAGLATAVAVEVCESSSRLFEVATAKIMAGEAAGIVAASGHQVHGAIGMTKEHHLHGFTRRLWSWRDEFGSEHYWSRRLGQHVRAQGAGQLWAMVATGLVETG